MGKENVVVAGQDESGEHGCSKPCCWPGALRDLMNTVPAREDLLAGKGKHLAGPVLEDVRKRLEGFREINADFNQKVTDMEQGLGYEGDARYILPLFFYVIQDTEIRERAEAFAKMMGMGMEKPGSPAPEGEEEAVNG